MALWKDDGRYPQLREQLRELTNDSYDDPAWHGDKITTAWGRLLLARDTDDPAELDEALRKLATHAMKARTILRQGGAK